MQSECKYFVMEMWRDGFSGLRRCIAQLKLTGAQRGGFGWTLLIWKGKRHTMTLTINLSDEQAAGLQAKAAAEGLSPEEWLQKIAERKPPESAAERPLQTAAEIILASMREVPSDIMATIPTDGASQHDHYIYGWPKRDV
jgi:hypothetical protein